MKIFGFRNWLFNEETINQLLGKSNDIGWKAIVLPEQFVSLSEQNQIILKKWIRYHKVNNLAGMDVLLDPNSEKELYGKKLTSTEYKFANLQNDNNIYHKKLQAVQNRKYPEIQEGQTKYDYLNPPIIFPNGFNWVILKKGYCCRSIQFFHQLTPSTYS